jgi:small-conductance mechanosensitive channel
MLAAADLALFLQEGAAARLESWLPALAILAGSVVLGIVVKSLVIGRLAAAFAKTQTQLDDLILAAIRRHLPLWFVLAGIAVAARVAPIEPKYHAIAERAAIVGLWISITLAAASFGGAFLSRMVGRNSALASSSLVRTLVRLAICLTGGLLIIQNLGIEISPIIAALGVGGLAVALGLQPTLADLFAGIHITTSGHVRVGDTVILESGPRGTIVDIDWRAVRIQDGNNNVVIVPNSKFSGMVVTNTQLPDSTVAAPVELGVAYSADLARVEKVALEEATAVQTSVPGADPNFAPIVRFTAFTDASVRLTVTMRALRFADQGLVVHELVKRLKARLAEEGLEMPTTRQLLVPPR